MDFIHTLITWLAEQNIIPAEVQSTDTDREKTYVQLLPATPANVYCVRLYDTALPTLTDKQTGVFYIQFLVRNKSHAQAIANIDALWKFLSNRPEIVEDITDTQWVIFDVRSGPIFVEQDAHGNYLYSLNVPIKTKIF